MRPGVSSEYVRARVLALIVRARVGFFRFISRRSGTEGDEPILGHAAGLGPRLTLDHAHASNESAEMSRKSFHTTTPSDNPEMAEGDTIYKLAAMLRPELVGRTVLAARTTKNASVGRLVGASITSVESLGKNLLIRFSSGLTLRTHMQMNGTWRTYASDDAGRRAAARAVVVLETHEVTAACFDAPVVELFDTRAEKIHPVLRRLGPDLLGETFDAGAVLARLRDPAVAPTTIAEALLDQRLMAGVGNVFRSEILFIERVDPFALVGDLDDATLERLIATAQRLLVVNVRPGRSRGRTTTEGSRAAAGQQVWVYNLAGRPCRRCATTIRARSLGRDLPRTVWWCPRCQAQAKAPAAETAETAETAGE